MANVVIKEDHATMIERIARNYADMGAHPVYQPRRYAERYWTVMKANGYWPLTNGERDATS